jgi:hypothetical protein
MEKIIQLLIGMIVVVSIIYFIFAPHPEKNDGVEFVPDMNTEYDSRIQSN